MRLYTVVETYGLIDVLNFTGAGEPDKILMKPTNEHIFVSIRAHLDKFPQGTH